MKYINKWNKIIGYRNNKLIETMHENLIVFQFTHVRGQTCIIPLLTTDCQQKRTKAIKIELYLCILYNKYIW